MDGRTKPLSGMRERIYNIHLPKQILVGLCFKLFFSRTGEDVCSPQSAPLHVAAAFGDIREIRYYLENSTSIHRDINEAFDDGNTPLHLAAGNGHLGK